MNHRYLVELPIQEKNELLHLTNKGKMAVRVMKRAQILLMSDHYQHTNKEISKVLSLSDATVHRIKKLYVEQGFERALYDKGGRGAKRKLTSLQEAKLVSIACSQHPTGSAKWTLKMLSDELILLCDDLDSISHETIRKRLKEKALKPWLLKMWCIPRGKSRATSGSRAFREREVQFDGENLLFFGSNWGAGKYFCIGEGWKIALMFAIVRRVKSVELE